MIFKIHIGRWRFTFSMAPLTKTIGVDSTLPDNNHILMWDFDDKQLELIASSLRIIQLLENLPTIFILNTGKPNSYIAYCFTRVTWTEAVRIIASTTGVDWNFFKYGVYRGKFTLRVGPKCGRKPKIAQTLYSNTPSTITIKELDKWTQYETFEDNWHSKKIEVRLFTHDN